MKLIETKTLGTAAASISFTSIPQTFTDLVVCVSARSTITATTTNFFVSFNGVGNTNRSGLLLRGDGSSVTSPTASNDRIGDLPGSSATANTFGNAQIYIPNYSGNLAKGFSTDSVTENNATASTQNLAALIWNDTAAITSIAFGVAGGASFEVGSTVSLYGITKGSDGITTAS